MKQLNSNETDDIIDMRDTLNTLLYYKKSIIIVILLFTLIASFRAYFSPNIYQSNALVKIGSNQYKNYKDDIGTRAMGKSEQNIDDEIVVFQTRDIADKSLEHINIGIRYYTTKTFKQVELYKSSPFIVNIKSLKHKANGLRINLYPIDKENFKLTIELPFETKITNAIRSFLSPLIKPKNYITYNKIHAFAKEIETPWFTITIEKKYQLKNNNYYFTMMPNRSMGGFIQGGISASLHAEFGNFIKLKFIDTVPLRSKDILETVINTYVTQSLDFKFKSIKNKLSYVDKQLKSINNNFKGSKEELENYRASNILINLSEKASMESHRLSNMESELYKANIQIGKLKDISKHLKIHNDIDGIDLNSLGQAGSIIRDTIMKIHESRLKRSGMFAYYGKEHPKIIHMNRQLDFMTKTLYETITNSLHTLNMSKISLKEKIEKSRIILKSFPKQEQELEQLSRNFMINEKIYSFLLQKRAEISIAESEIVSDVSIAERPMTPRGSIKPKPALVVLTGLMIGLMLGIMQAFVRSFFDNTIKTIEDIEKLTDIPIYGSTPLINKKKDNTKHYEESMRVIFNNLEFIHIKDKSQLITFTSVIASEGKTFTISRLANMIAAHGKSVIVLDLDMRKATLHKIYNLPNKVGMSTLLSNKNTLVECIQNTSLENLKIITSGPRHPNPTNLIMSNKLETVIATLMKQYDYILLDSPPIGLVADAMKIMRMSDLTLFVIRSNISKKDFIKTAERFTKDAKINSGIILNAIELKKYYGYMYGYGYEY